MKTTYHWLKDFVEIKISPEKLAEKLTMAGIEVKSIQAKAGDFIFEVEITANRPDWLSVAGLAREIAAITRVKLWKHSHHCEAPLRLRSGQAPSLKQSQKRDCFPFATLRVAMTSKRYPLNAKALKIIIEDKKDCPLYTAKIIKGVKVGPSPKWLAKRLELIGCRSINNVVDIANYILFTYGEPLHAFDLDKLVSGLRLAVSDLEIFIRRAKDREEITTIDGVKRILDNQTLVIASGAHRTPYTAHRVIAIAGIMGGKDTEVDSSTKNILLEAAMFDPMIIRRSRQKLGMQTDSAYRFERGVDYQTVNIASDAAASLICEVCSGELTLVKAAGSRTPQEKEIILDLEKVSRLLGVNISPAQAKKILEPLGFKARPKSSQGLKVKVPPFRQDVQQEADLSEEISRVYGYENIPLTLPAFYPQPENLNQPNFIPLLKNILIGLGLNEAITYSLIDRRIVQGFSGLPQPVEVENPLSQEQEILRPTILPGLLKCVGRNLNQKQEDIRLFEVGKIYYQDKGSFKEEPVLGIVLCGTAEIYLPDGTVKDTLGILHLKGIVESILTRLGISGGEFKQAGNQVEVYLADKKIAELFNFSGKQLELFEIKNRQVAGGWIGLDALADSASLEEKYVKPPLYPGITRDISLLVKEQISVADLLRAIKQAASSLLAEAEVVDYYKGKQIPDGLRSITISCLYRSAERTLTESEVNPLHNRACEMLVSSFSAQIR